MTKLPNGWEVKKLENICKLQNGFAFKSSLFSKNGVPIVRIKNIQNEKVVLEDLVYCNPNDYENDLTSYTICKNDILIAMSGATTGKIGLYDLEEKAYLNQRVGLLRISDEVTRKYIFWFLYFNSGKNLNIALGAAQPNLSTAQIHNIQIPLPSLKDQRKIVKILNEKFASIDESIRLAKVDLLSLDELWQSILNDSFNPLKSKLDNDTYTLPPTWKLEKLGDIATTSSGGTPKRTNKEYWENGTINWLKSGELNDYLINNVEEKITQIGLNSSSAKIYPKGTLLIAMYGATAGKLGILNIETSTNQAVCAIFNKNIKNVCFKENYLFYYLLFKRDKIILDSFGGAQPNISQTYVKNMQIPLPPLKEQECIAKELESKAKTIKELKELYVKRLKDYEELKESLLDLAFKGGL
ncbi:restriction endonuclease subunit S [Campylobacter sp. RM12637]|uniref:restriction endonuclease subunit S n=1 Tax=Campylobacter sp. RM12637 TaxID=2735734 RepID=UPI0030146E5F|nr:restriction endonuclease subunit S [Campylobacter sp. RM12637]